MGRSDLASFLDLTHEKISPFILCPLFPHLPAGCLCPGPPEKPRVNTQSPLMQPDPRRALWNKALLTHPSLLGTELHKMKKLTPNLFNTEIASVVGYWNRCTLFFYQAHFRQICLKFLSFFPHQFTKLRQLCRKMFKQDRNNEWWSSVYPPCFCNERENHY